MAEIHSSDAHLNVIGVGGAIAMTPSEGVGTKRQRRPSVRLGEIGGDHQLMYDGVISRRSNNNSASKQWKQQHQHQQRLQLHPHVALKESAKGSRTRALTNLSTSTETIEEEKEVNFDTVAFGSWKVKESKKRGASSKRVRSNTWISKKVEGDEKYSGDGENEIVDDTYRDEYSESPVKEQIPMNLGDGNERIERSEREMCYYNSNSKRRVIGGKESYNHDQDHRDVDLSGPSDDDDGDGDDDDGVREYRDNNGGGVGEDGVRIWLNGLGLGRYAPVFEIHEVDDEVLPMLTLEDLKDMGINAVGSRRKMFCAIQKLGKGFS